MNKVNTKVRAAVSFESLAGLSLAEREQAKSRLKNCINIEGKVFVEAEDERFDEILADAQKCCDRVDKGCRIVTK